MALYPNLAFVTVMDVEVYAKVDGTNYTLVPGGSLDCLTISNITQEGPRKEARGGLNATPCIRYGKTMRLEMEDVVMRSGFLEWFFDADITSDTADHTDPTQISFTETFAKGIILVGTTYIVDKTTGNRQQAQIAFYNFLPDSVTDITMESEGDIGMIGIAGELFANSDGKFFTIIDNTPTTGEKFNVATTGVVTVVANT